METQFVYFSEDTKFRIVSSIFVTAIIVLVILSSLGNNVSADFTDFENGKITYYSKILGFNPPGDSRFNSQLIEYGHRFNISFNGNTVFAANSE